MPRGWLILLFELSRFWRDAHGGCFERFAATALSPNEARYFGTQVPHELIATNTKPIQHVSIRIFSN